MMLNIMRNNKGQFEKELERPTLLQFYIEGHQRNWLKEQKKKRKITFGAIIRSLINSFMQNREAKQDKK